MFKAVSLLVHACTNEFLSRFFSFFSCTVCFCSFVLPFVCDTLICFIIWTVLSEINDLIRFDFY